MVKEEKNTVNSKKQSKLLSTQRYLDFASAHDDTLILKNGGIRAVLEVSSVNFNLKSDDEQNAIIYGYQRFLNALNFPVQLLVRSRRLDVDQYLKGLDAKMLKQQNQLLKKQMEEYIEYIGKLVEYADIMEKKFYVVVPQNPYRTESVSMWTSFWQKIHPDDPVEQIIVRRKEFNFLKKGLDERLNIVNTGLENCGLSASRLSTQELIELFYQSYNPENVRAQKLENVNAFAHEGNPEDQLVN